MEIVPRKNPFLQKYYEMCPGFLVRDDMKKHEEVVCQCLWCAHAEFLHGFDTAEKVGGCHCLAGYDTQVVGHNPVTPDKEREVVP